MTPKKSLITSAPAGHHPCSIYSIKPKAFLNKNKQYIDISVASYIFYPPADDLIPPAPFPFVTHRGMVSNAPFNAPIEPARLLLLQRALTDALCPDLWEVPWGAAAFSDETILHSVRRVIRETTGLHLKDFLEQVGHEEESETGEGLFVRLNFMVEIKEMTEFDAFAACPTLGDLDVELDSKEFQDFVWATEKEILADVYPLVTPQQRDAVLQAFEQRGEIEEAARAQAVNDMRARKDAASSGKHGRASDEEGEGNDEDENGMDKEDDEERDRTYEAPNSKTRKKFVKKSNKK